jgi:alpha-beta hydrolase superfamily lysophospholipase
VARLLLVLLLVACATPDPGLRADLPHPPTGAGVARSDLTMTGSDGVALFAQKWLPPQSVRGVLVLVHGLKDHSDRYSGLVAKLEDAGFAVYALDLRGHGRSAGARVTVAHFDEYVDDVARLVELAQQEQPGAPVFVFGHSMGGAIVTTYAETRHPKINGVILSAPAIGLDAPAFEAGFIGGLGEVPLLDRLPLFQPKSKLFSQEADVVDGMNGDPLIWNHGAPVHTPAELIGAIGRVWDRASQLEVPIVILHGTADRLTAPAASRDFLARVGTSDHTLNLYPGQWHDLVHEPMRDQVANDVLAWMEARLTGPSTSPPLQTERLGGDHVGTAGRLAIAGAYTTAPKSGGAQMSVSFALGRLAMIGVDGEGRIGKSAAGWGLLTIGTRFGRWGWVTAGFGGGYLAVAALIAQADVELAPPGVPLALHLRATDSRGSDAVRGELEGDLRWPGDRTFWGRGRRGAGLTVGARYDASRILTILAGIEVTGFD